MTALTFPNADPALPRPFADRRQRIREQQPDPLPDSTLSSTQRVEPTVQILIPSESPDWLKGVIAALREILALRDNWDRQGAKPVGAPAVVLALNLLTAVIDDEPTVTPWVVPRPNGGLQLEWHTEEHSLEISISPLGDKFSAGSADEEWEGTLADVDKLFAALTDMNAIS